MMRNLVFAVAFIILGTAGISQPCGEIAKFCENNMAENYVSDGQSYRALLVEEEVAEFRATFYGGNTYRLAGCSGNENGNLIFAIYDLDRRPIFTNQEFEYSGYWDFQVEHTFDCIIEAQLNLEKVESGCAVLLISFEN